MNSVGIGTRVITFIVDGIIVFLLTYVAYRSWSWYVFYYNIKYFPFYNFWFAVTFLYYLLFEGIWRRTPGKWASLTKVVGAGGKKASFVQILVRSAIRAAGFILIDSLFFPIWGRTLHDYVSKTYVVEV
jgi:uncharacterized RDD family membrane protein YckC